MKIAYVLGHFPVLSETFVGEEIRALEKAGNTIFPIALQNPNTEYQPDDAELVSRTYYFSSITKKYAEYLTAKYLFKLFRFIPFCLRQTTEPKYHFFLHCADIALYISKNNCQHIHAHFGWGATTYAIGAAKLLNIPITFTCHGSDVYVKPLDLKIKCNAANAVVCVSDKMKQDIQAIAPKAICHVIYCGMDTNKFQPNPNAIKNNKWLFVGRLVDCKGLDDIILAMAEISAEIRPMLDIVGEGVLKNELEQLVNQKKLSNNIKFLGAKNSKWIAENAVCYKAFISAFKKGSDNSRDTGPLVLKEAMAMGLPIVTTDFDSIPKIVSGGCAIICNSQSVDSIKDAILSVEKLSDYDLQKMSSVGRIKSENEYSINKQINQLISLFKKFQ